MPTSTSWGRKIPSSSNWVFIRDFCLASHPVITRLAVWFLVPTKGPVTPAFKNGNICVEMNLISIESPQSSGLARRGEINPCKNFGSSSTLVNLDTHTVNAPLMLLTYEGMESLGSENGGS